MKNSKIIALIFSFFICSGCEVRLHWKGRPNARELMDAEAANVYAAVDNSIIKEEKQNEQTNETCECKGTGKVRSGDGLIELPCSCGPGCKCSKTGHSEYTEVKKQRTKYILYFSQKNCAPCVQVEQTTFPKLKSTQWIIGSDPKGHIVYSNALDIFSVDSTPTFILMDGDKELSRYSGYLNFVGIEHLWYQKPIVQSDTVLK